MGNGDRLLRNKNTKPGVKRLTSSSSRSMAESTFMMEPLSGSIEEEASATGRSIGLTKSNGKRGERGQQERGERGMCRTHSRS